MKSTENKKSLKLNMLFNAIKGLMSIIFPLITFPYTSKVLGVTNIGKYNFSNSVISYFLLLAGLGISTYAVREGAKIRNDRNKISLFASEIFTINCVSEFFSIFLLIVCINMVSKLQMYKDLLYILVIQILFSAVNVEWIYSIYEEYAYITVRTICFQIISLILLFTTVKSERDIGIYTSISVITSMMTNITNFWYSKKFCKIKLTKKINYKKHIKPIMTLFFMSITISIYVASDTTMLGFMCGDYAVGIYSLSTKIYSIVKTIISSVLVVSIPRLSALLCKNDKTEFKQVATDIYKMLLTIMLPTTVGLILVRKEIILLISNEQYLSAETSLILLCFALFFCMGAWFWGQCILVPMQKEKSVFYITVASALVNIILNLFMIPIGRENAAAFTTIVAEAIAYFGCMYMGRKYTHLGGLFKIIIKIIVGCLGIIITILIMNPLKGLPVIHFMSVIFFSCLFYIGIEVFLKNEIIIDFINEIHNRIMKNSR